MRNRSLQVRIPRLVAVALIGLVAVAAGSCRRKGPGGGAAPLIERNDVTVRMGVAGIQTYEGWNLLTIDVANRGADFEGEVRATGGLGYAEDFHPGPVTARVRTQIARGSTRRLSLPVRPGEWTAVRVALSQPGFSVSWVYDFPYTPFDYRVLVVAGRSAALGGLAEWIEASCLASVRQAEDERRRRQEAAAPPGMVMPSPDSPAGETARPPRRRPDALSLVTATAAELPARAEGLDSFQHAVIFGDNLADAPPESIAAVARWVERGGSLVVFPGGQWSAGLPAEFAALLGVERLEGEARAPAHLLEAAGADPGNVIYEPLRPIAGGESVAGGLAVVTRRGCGRVIVFSIRPAGDAFPDLSRAGGIAAILRPEVLRSMTFARSPGPGLARLEGVLPDILFNMSGFRVPGVEVVAISLVVYLVLGFLVPGFIFKRLRRREWTYAVILLAAVAASFGIYRYGLLSARENLETTEISVLRVHDGGERAEATTFFGVMSPRLERVRVLETGAAKAGALPQPMLGIYQNDWRRQGEKMDPLRIDLDASPEGDLDLAPMLLYPNAMAHVVLEHRVDTSGFLAIETERLRTGEPIRVSVTNRAGSRMRLHVVWTGRHSEIGELSPGGTQVFDRSTRPSSRRTVADGVEQYNAWQNNARQAVLSRIVAELARPPSLRSSVDADSEPIVVRGAIGDTVAAAPRPEGIAVAYIVAELPGTVLPAGEAVRERRGFLYFIIELPAGVVD